VERGPRRPPAERVRDRVRRSAGAPVASALPNGYQRLGRVLVLRLPARLRPHFAEIGRAWQAELGVATVLVRTGPIAGALREPTVERIAGDGTETEVVEHRIRWRFDAARVMFAAGNRTERARMGRLVRPGEDVVDLFAGIGYFSIPMARAEPTVRVRAVEVNPVAHRYLLENAALNGVGSRVDCRLGDNRVLPLEPGRAHRVVMGYLPDAVPWTARAIGLLRPEGGWLHVHAVEDARGPIPHAVARVRAAIAVAGGTEAGDPTGREVKPYGPGRTHVVVDARVVPNGQERGTGAWAATASTAAGNAAANRSMSAAGFENETRAKRLPNFGER
jgi:tRNA wybutosine-synthesizing protein 2